MEQPTCRQGHCHKNERDAEACDRRQSERALAVAARHFEGVRLIQEARYAFYVDRRQKVAS